MDANTMTRGLSRIALASAALLSGCMNLAPGYTRPAAPVPAAWPATGASGAGAMGGTRPTPAESAATPEAAATDLGWRDVVRDTRLRDTIALALEHNRDLRVAVLNIEQARAAYRIQEAAEWPAVNATASHSSTRTPAEASTTRQDTLIRSNSLAVGLSAYELDLFGRVRNLRDAALESFLNTEEAQRSTRLSLVAQVASAWLTLAADQSLLELARATLKAQQTSYELTRRRHALGADSGLTLAQAQTSVESARRDVAAYDSVVRQDRNALDLLAGTPVPDALLPQQLGEPAARLVGVPAGLPSTVLQRRPDVLAAEHALKAANADIGAARAARFPRISLTASAGTASRALDDLFKGGAWNVAPALSLTLLDAGATAAAVRQAEVVRDIRLASYDKTLQTAFREVADALAVRATVGERLAAQQALVDATQRSFDLAQARYRGGASGFLDVLDAQRSLYTAQQALISLQLAEQTNRVNLFRVLGGGWRETAAQDAVPATAASGVASTP